MNAEFKPDNWHRVRPARLVRMLTKTFSVIGIGLIAAVTVLFLPNSVVLIMLTLAFSDSSEKLYYFFAFVALIAILLSLMYYLLRRKPKKEKTLWLVFSLFPIFVLSSVLSLFVLTLID